MSLLELLCKTTPRETSGSLTNRRFEYQTAWGIYHLLQLHSAGTDYAVAFEFHDDVMVVNHSTNPTECRFYQVKTKSRNGWTLNALSKRENGSMGLKPSILGKMHDHISKFGESVKEVVFVSNQKLSFITTEKNKCCFIEAPAPVFEEFVKKLIEECDQAKTEDAHLFNFERSKLPTVEFETFLKGRLAELVDDQCGDLNYNITAFYRIVVDTCRGRSLREISDTSQDELFDAKFVTRRDVSNWLITLSKASEAKPNWLEVSADLSSMDTMEKLNIRRYWKIYEAKNFDRAPAHIALKSTIRNAITNHLVIAGSQLSDTLNSILLLVQSRAREIEPSLSVDFLKAGILYELYDEKPENPVQVANQELEEESK